MAAKAKERILESSQKLILEQGYNGTGTNAIISDAGVSKGSFFYHFPDKPALIEATLERYFEEELESPLRNALQAHDNPKKALIAYIDDIALLYEKADYRGGCLLGNIALELSDTHDGVRRLVGNMFERWRNILADALKDYRLSLDTEDFITLYIAAIEGVTMTIKTHKLDRRARAEFSACKKLVEIAFAEGS